MKKIAVTTIIVTLVVILIVVGVSAPTAFAQPAGQQNVEDGTRRVISVSGSGFASVPPDTAVITIGVRTEAEEASAALDQNSQQMTELINALRQAGIAQDNIQTQYVSLSPRYSNQPTENGQPQVTGYIATNTVQVTILDIDQVGQILDTAVQSGGNLIESIRFEISDPQQAQQQARTQAFEDAREKADQLAQLAGVQLVQVISIVETSSLPPRPFAAGGAAEAAADMAVPIEPGTQNVQIDLQVSWEITGNQTVTRTPIVPTVTATPTLVASTTPTPFVNPTATTAASPSPTSTITNPTATSDASPTSTSVNGNGTPTATPGQ